MKRHWDWDRSIHSYHSNSHLLDESSRCRAVAGKYRRSVPIFMIIHQLDCLPNVIDTHHAENRTENLFPVNAHFRSDMIKQGPISTPGASPGPILSAFTRGASASTKQSPN